MTNAPGARGRGTGGETGDEPLFPSEGTFSAVVPLSQIDGTDDVPAEEVARGATEAHEDEEQAHENDEETTLVHARVTQARPTSPVGLQATPRSDLGATRGDDLRPKAGGQSWLVTAAVLILSILAGAAAGVYLISSRGTRDASRQSAPAAAPSGDVAAEATRHAPPASAPTPAPAAPEAGEANEGGEAGEKRGAGREAAPSPESTPDAPRDDARASEPTPRRVTAAAQPRAERPTRADDDGVETRAAPKPARRADAASRPRENVADKRTHAAAERSLPISAPPASAKPKKVIQWP